MKDFFVISCCLCACSGTVLCKVMLFRCDGDGAARYKNTGAKVLCVRNCAREDPLIFFGADKLSQPTQFNFDEYLAVKF
jgi:hypothetical protein